MQLGRFLIKQANYSRKQVLCLLVQQLVKVDGLVVTARDEVVSEFSEISVDGKVVQAKKIARYYMMNKPQGILSATADLQHKTVMDVMQQLGFDTVGLHIAGRLDRSTTGLILLTNDGKWSRQIMEPSHKVAKVYLVTLAYPISPDTVEIFQQGIYFATENITTQPAQLERISDLQYRLTIYEGRYHQVKRMFAFVGNRVVKLHRESVGEYCLFPELKLGDVCRLNPS